MFHHVRRRSVFGLLSLGLVAGTTVAVAPAAQADTATKRYIVSTVDATGKDRALTRLRREGRRPTETYSRVFQGFAAKLTDSQVASLRSDPRVRAVVPDRVIRIATTQSDAEWGLDRIDRRSNTLNDTYDYSTTGAGVNAFVLDTGVRLTHSEFGGRAVSGRDFVDGDNDASDCVEEDATGHGTHVAGILAGSTYGVAKSARVVALRTLDCAGEGYESDFVEALDWVLTHRENKPAVVNISAGILIDDDDPGSDVLALEQAVNEVIDSGIPVVVAAGNGGESATHTSPARVADAITVGSTTRSGRRSSFSNYGSRIDLFAPGSGIRSAYPFDDTDSEILDGTSMATPFVAGAIARYLQAYPTASPAAVRAALVGDSTKDELSSLGKNSADRMLYLRRSTTGAATAVTANHSTALNKMRIRWSAPYGFGATAVTGYRVTRSGTDANGQAFAPTVISASARDYAWSNLKDSPYKVTVEPINASGAGPAVARTD